MALTSTYVMQDDSEITASFSSGVAALRFGAKYRVDLDVISFDPADLASKLEAAAADLRAASVLGVVA